MATHSSILAQRILWTKEPGRGPRGHKESDRTKATQHDVVRENRTGHLSDSYLHFVIKDKYLFLFNKIKKKIFGCTTRFVVSQFPDQRWNPKPQQRKSRIPTTGLPGNSQGSLNCKIWSYNALCLGYTPSKVHGQEKYQKNEKEPLQKHLENQIHLLRIFKVSFSVSHFK